MWQHVGGRAVRRPQAVLVCAGAGRAVRRIPPAAGRRQRRRAAGVVERVVEREGVGGSRPAGVVQHAHLRVAAGRAGITDHNPPDSPSQIMDL